MKKCILYTTKHNDDIFIDNIQYYDDIIIKYIAYNRNVPLNEIYRNIPIISMDNAYLFYDEIDTVLIGENIEECELIKNIAINAINEGKDIYICSEISSEMQSEISELACQKKCEVAYLNTIKKLNINDLVATQNIIIMSLYFNPDSYKLQLALAQSYGFNVDNNAPFSLFINKKNNTKGKIYLVPELVFPSVSKTNTVINEFKRMKQNLLEISKVILVLPYDDHCYDDILRNEEIINKLYQVNIDEIIISNYIINVFSNPRRVIKRNPQNSIEFKQMNNRIIPIGLLVPNV